MRKGNEKNRGCIIIISNSVEACKEVQCGNEYANAVLYDFLQQRQEEILLDKEGKGLFTVNACSVSVWVKK